MLLYYCVTLIFYVRVNKLSVMNFKTGLSYSSTKLGLMCIAQSQNAVTPMMLDSAAPRWRVKHSTTEPILFVMVNVNTKSKLHKTRFHDQVDFF